METTEEFVDVFPSTVLEDIDQWKDLCKPTDYVRMDSEAFVCYIPVDKVKIRYKHVPKTAREIQNFNYNLKQAQNWLDAVEDPCWERAERRMRRSTRADRKRCDVTLAFRHANTFLTKSLFTFGVRRTGSREHHVIQVFQAPLVFYRLKNEERDASSSYYYAERTFREQDRIRFDAFELVANSTYGVGPDKTYVLMTVKKCLFAIDRCTENLARQIDAQKIVLDPTDKVFRP